MADAHYLKEELYGLVQGDPAIFEFLQNGSLDGIWYWDLENPEHEWMSPRFWEVFGYEPGEKPHLAEAWQDMIHPADLEVALDNFQRHCADPSHKYDQVVRYRHRDGSTVWVRCRGTVVRNDQGEPIRMLGAHTDLTALKQTEAALEQRTVELERSNAELAQFAYVASHDLQEPLRMVVSFLDLLNQRCGEQLDDKALTYLGHAKDGAARMQLLISDILALSRVGTGEQQLQPTDLAALVAAVLRELTMTIREHKAEVEVGSLPTMVCDKGQIKQLFHNLLSNALKFVDHEPPRVTVSAERIDDGAWKFDVADQGVGFDPHFAESVFQIFKRLHPRGEYEGTGIGLAICQRVVERHGGRIWAESEPGKGATISFILPEQSTDDTPVW